MFVNWLVLTEKPQRNGSCLPFYPQVVHERAVLLHIQPFCLTFFTALCKFVLIWLKHLRKINRITKEEIIARSRHPWWFSCTKCTNRIWNLSFFFKESAWMGSIHKHVGSESSVEAVVVLPMALYCPSAVLTARHFPGNVLILILPVLLFLVHFRFE